MFWVNRGLWKVTFILEEKLEKWCQETLLNNWITINRSFHFDECKHSSYSMLWGSLCLNAQIRDVGKANKQKPLSSTREGEDINKEGTSLTGFLFVLSHSAYYAKFCLVSVCKHHYCLWAVFIFILEQLNLTKTVNLSSSQKKMIQTLHLDLCVLVGRHNTDMFHDY